MTLNTNQEKNIHLDPALSKLVNYIMRDGKKSLALRLMKEVIETIGTTDPIARINQAIESLEPEVEVRSKRVGGSTYMVPTPVNAKRKRMLSIRWILQGARARNERGFSQKLAAELQDILNASTCFSIKKRDELLKQAESNRSFAHFLRRR